MNAIELAEECGAVILGGVFMLDVNELQAFYEAAKQEGRDELQVKLQEEVEALKLRVARLATALEGLMAGYEVRCSGEENAEWDTCYSKAQRALTLDDVNKGK